MGWTTVQFRGAEFVANDLVIELWLLEVVRHIESETATAPWLRELSVEWRLQAKSGFGFGPSPALDDFANSDARRERLVEVFQMTLESLNKRTEMITPSEISQSGVGGPNTYYSQDVPTRTVIEVGHRFLSLLK